MDGRRTYPRLFSLPAWWSWVFAAGPGTRTRTRALSGPTRTFGALFLLLVVAGLLYFDRLGSPLLEPEDSHYAEVPREMAVAGDWVVPLYGGQPYYQKPPLFFWLVLVAYSGFGIQDWAARLVPCLAGLGTVLVTFWWGKKVSGLRTGLAAALILCLSPRFLHQTRMITLDGLLGLWILCALALGQQALQPGRLRWGCWFLSAAACALGLLTKGPVALILAAVPLLAYQVLDRRTARPGGWCWPAYVGTAIGLASPWFVAMSWRHPVFLREFFWTHHVVMRFVQPLHEEPAWFFLPVMFLGMLPWTLLLPVLIKLLFRRSAAGRANRPPELGFWLLCSLWCLAFYSVADCKRIGYIVPAMPPLALALGYAVDRRLLRSVHRGRLRPVARCWIGCGVATFGLLLLTVHLLLPGYYERFSLRAQVQLTSPAVYRSELPVACYPRPWDSVNYYLGRHDVRTYGPDERDRLIADLQSGSERLVFVKSGSVLDDLLGRLPASVEFVPISHGEIATAGLMRPRDVAQAHGP